MDETPRQMRISSTVRGITIAVMIAAYSWMFKLPGSSWTGLLLGAAGVQLAVIVARRMVPADNLPQAMYVIEMVADGITVLMFALAVFGSIPRAPDGM